MGLVHAARSKPATTAIRDSRRPGRRRLAKAPSGGRRADQPLRHSEVILASVREAAQDELRSVEGLGGHSV